MQKLLLAERLECSDVEVGPSVVRILIVAGSFNKTLSCKN